MSLDPQLSQKIEWINHYEERLLFSLIHLQNPQAHLVYLTSQPVDPELVNYYLQFLPGVSVVDARQRLTLFSTQDASLKPLSQKILERPRLIHKLRQALIQDQSCMICFNSTALERSLSVQLDIPLFALDPDLQDWGSKTGSRQIFSECGVPHPPGSGLVQQEQDLAIAVNQLWEQQPSLQRVLIKLNQGFSGFGNALLDLRSLQAVAPGSASAPHRIAAIAAQFPVLRFQSTNEDWSTFQAQIQAQGAIAEAFIEGEVKQSPSVQGCILPGGKVEIVSTHEQFLGGLDAMTYLGCAFPAHPGYRLQLQELGQRVGENLAAKGAIDHFSVDFVAVQRSPEIDPASWEFQAIEINLRKGGTTHPFMLLKALTTGRYDHNTGLFYNQDDIPKYYVASDNLKSPNYQGLLPDDLIEIVTQHGLNFDQTTETGTIFHLASTLSEFGKLGLTCIGNSPEEAEAIYKNVVSVLNQETAG